MIGDSTTNLLAANKKYCKAIDTLAGPVISYMQTSFFGYLKVDASGNIKILSNHHNWLQHYFDNEFYLYDPHIVHPNNMIEGFTLWSSASRDQVHYRGIVLLEAIELFQMNCGGSIIRTQPNKEHYEAFMFNGQDKYTIYSQYLNRRFCLEHFIDYFLEKYNEIIETLPSMNMLKIKDNFNSQKGILNKRKPPPWA